MFLNKINCKEGKLIIGLGMYTARVAVSALRPVPHPSISVHTPEWLISLVVSKASNETEITVLEDGDSQSLMLGVSLRERWLMVVVVAYPVAVCHEHQNFHKE